MIVITKNGRIVNPACQPYDDSPEAQALRKHLAEPPKGEAPSGELEASGTEGTEKATIDKSIVSQYRPSVKEFETVRAQMALRAHTLTAKPHQSGLTLWEVGKWGQVRVFSHWSDVLAFRAQIGV